MAGLCIYQAKNVNSYFTPASLLVFSKIWSQLAADQMFSHLPHLIWWREPRANLVLSPRYKILYFMQPPIDFCMQPISKRKTYAIKKKTSCDQQQLLLFYIRFLDAYYMCQHQSSHINFIAPLKL